MPEFESYIDVDTSEFVDACSKREIDALIECLSERGYIKSESIRTPNDNLKNVIESEWETIVDNIKEKRVMISIEDEETIRKISKKY